LPDISLRTRAPLVLWNLDKRDLRDWKPRCLIPGTYWVEKEAGQVGDVLARDSAIDVVGNHVSSERPIKTRRMAEMDANEISRGTAMVGRVSCFRNGRRMLVGADVSWWPVHSCHPKVSPRAAIFACSEEFGGTVQAAVAKPIG